jgi:protein-tyrosine phosphatase
MHCAVGQGRSATLVAALLVRLGRADDVADAEQKLRAIRPGVRLADRQRRFVDDHLERIGA